MTSSANYSYHIIPPSTSFVLELNKAGGDDQNHHHQLLTSSQKSEVSSSSNNSSFPFSSPLFYCSSAPQDQVDAVPFKQDRDQYFEKPQFIPQQVDHKLVSQGDQPCSHRDHPSSMEDDDDDQRRSHDLNISMWKKEDEMRDDHHHHHHHHDQADNCYTVKWMSSKMRIMRKMISPSSDQEARLNVVSSSINNLGGHQKQFEDPKQLPSSLSSQETDHSSSNSSSTIVRVCADCNTTKTPLWRSGPRGPKSLCNACGIRQRKARRAAAAAAAATAANGEHLPAESPNPTPASIQHKNKRSSIINKSASEFKKKRKAKLPKCHHHQLSAGGRKLCLEEFAIRLSKHLAFQRVFPQEEKEAAILLMALSHGLVQG